MMSKDDASVTEAQVRAESPIVAAIDIGTNSVKVIVAALAEGSVRRLYETAQVTRLGEGMQAQSPRLREAAMRRTLDALAEMVRAAHEYGVEQFVTVGTAALREAENRDEFRRRTRERCNLEIEVIPGQEEARLSFLAVRRDPAWRDCAKLLVIDIGGGSTEIVQGDPVGDGIATRMSVNLGAVRVTDRYLKSDPPTIAELATANQAVVQAFGQVEVSAAEKPLTLVGVGGTLTNLAGMDHGGVENTDQLHGYVLTADRLETQVERLSRATVAQRREIVGLDPRRADIILGGAILLSQAMAYLGCNEVAVSARGLRWGLLYDRFESF